ncbi:hypothetical protein D3C80_987380 [compost metagenome]
MAHFQLKIPQQGDKLPHALGLLFIQPALAQHQHVNVRKRVQFATAITADRHQSGFRNIFETVEHPQATQQAIDKVAAGGDQAFGAGAGIERFCQPQLELFEALFQRDAVELLIAIGVGIFRLLRHGLSWNDRGVLLAKVFRHSTQPIKKAGKSRPVTSCIAAIRRGAYISCVMMLGMVSSLRNVIISQPLSVTTIVCSYCADKLRSLVFTVQPSFMVRMR